jgi:hypothetical protein
MKSGARVSLAIGLALAFSASVTSAQTPAAPPPAAPPAAPDKPSAGAPGVVMADVVVINATVEAVDKDKRTVTLKGSGGRQRDAQGGSECQELRSDQGGRQGEG